MTKRRMLTEERRWEATKEAILKDLTGNKRATLETVMENTKVGMEQIAHLTGSATVGATGAGNIAALNKVILPIIRRVMPTVIANELVGVQPMTGPIGQIHTLRVSQSETAAGVTAGAEALSPFEIAAGYSGNELTGEDGGPGSTSRLEGQPGNMIGINVLKQTVEAKSRKLSARWTFEAAQDAQAMHGIDVETEVMGALAQEITAEIDQEIIRNLTTLAGTAAHTYNQAQVSGTGTFVGDEHAALAVVINKVANDIAARTRRGAGNWAVVSPNVLTVLQSATTSAFARTTEGPFEAPTNTKFVGTLNNSMRVYVNQYATNDNILVGYKGSNETDAAAFYCPYIPLMSSGTVLDPNTMEPVMSFMTRYGYVELDNQASSLGNAADYVGRIDVENLAYS